MKTTCCFVCVFYYYIFQFSNKPNMGREYILKGFIVLSVLNLWEYLQYLKFQYLKPLEE